MLIFFILVYFFMFGYLLYVSFVFVTWAAEVFCTSCLIILLYSLFFMSIIIFLCVWVVAPLYPVEQQHQVLSMQLSKEVLGCPVRRDSVKRVSGILTHATHSVFASSHCYSRYCSIFQLVPLFLSWSYQLPAQSDTSARHDAQRETDTMIGFQSLI